MSISKYDKLDSALLQHVVFNGKTSPPTGVSSIRRLAHVAAWPNGTDPSDTIRARLRALSRRGYVRFDAERKQWVGVDHDAPEGVQA